MTGLPPELAWAVGVSAGLLLVFVCVMFVLAALFWYFRLRLFKQRRTALRRVTTSLRGLAAPIDWAAVENTVAEYPWLHDDYEEFREQCWEHDGALFNSEQAGRFFTEAHVRPSEKAGWDIVPSSLTGIGILGTFIGIVFGLWPIAGALLNASTGGGDGTEAALNTATAQLVAGLVVSFITSIAGLILSLGATGLQRGIEDALEAERLGFISWLNAEVERGVGPHLLMQQLHLLQAAAERDREWQRSVHTALEDQKAELQHLAQGMGEVFENAIKGSGLVGAVRGMADSISSSQTEGLGQMLDSFNTKLSDHFGENFQTLGHSMDQMVQANQSYQTEMNTLVGTLGQGIDKQIQASEVVQRVVAQAAEAVQSIEVVTQTLDAGARNIAGAAKQMNDAIASQRDALEQQRAVNQDVVGVVREQAEGWSAHQRAIVDAYGGIQQRFAGLEQAVTALRDWHEQVRAQLGDQMQTWLDAVARQESLTETMGQERAGWQELVESLSSWEQFTKELNTASAGFNRLGVGLEQLTKRLSAEVGSLRATQDAGQQGLAVVGSELKELGSSLGDSWKDYAKVARELSTSMPDIEALLKGLTSAVAAQQSLVDGARGVSAAFRETGSTQRGLVEDLGKLVAAADKTRQAMEPAAGSFHRSAQALERATATLQSADKNAEAVSTALVRAATQLKEADRQALGSWSRVNRSMEQGAATFTAAMDEYENNVDSAVSKTFKDFDGQLANAVGQLAGAVGAIHKLVEQIDDVVSELEAS